MKASRLTTARDELVIVECAIRQHKRALETRPCLAEADALKIALEAASDRRRALVTRIRAITSGPERSVA